jgi:PAS domain S-box-containing protein
MTPASSHEIARLEALHQYKILDTDPEEVFDDITRLAAYICQTPIALISLIDAERQWFKSRVGLEATESHRDFAFCNYAIEQSNIFTVADAAADERFADNPLVTAAPHIRFYAGIPLTTLEGHALGTLCVIDQVPRTLNADQQAALEALGRQATKELELRRNLADLERVAIQRRHKPNQREFFKVTIGVVAAAILVAIGISSYQGIIGFLNAASGTETVTLQSIAKSLAQVLRNLVLLLLLFYFVDREIIQRDEIADSLEQERDFSSAILDTVGALIIVLDPQGRIVRFNRNCEQTTGYTFAEVRNRYFWDLFINAAEVEAIKTTFADLQSGNFPNTHENHWVTRNGERRLIRWSNTALSNENVVEYVIGTGIDITDRKRAEEALSQLAAIVESSDDAVIGTTLDGKILSWNAGAEKIYGYLAEEAKGQSLSALLVPPADLEEIQTAAQLNQPINSRETQHRRKDGKLIDIFLTVSLVKNTAGEISGVSMIARDVSDRRTVERMKDEFISVVSHELRTPLTSLQGSLKLLVTGRMGTLPEKGNRMLEIALNNTNRLMRLVNDMLDLERLESDKLFLVKKPCSIATIIQQAVESVQAMAEKAEVTLSVSTLPTQVSADSDRLIQVFTNLLSNAIKFSPPGTTIWLTATVPEIQGSQLRQEVLITVKDEGRGIPCDKLEAIFGRFQQVDASDSRQRGGTGLGLAICRSIVQQHEGQIWAESQLGEGSAFFVKLPLLQEPESITVSASLSPALPPSPNNRRILVCRNLLVKCGTLQSFLKEQGYEAIPVTIDIENDIITQVAELCPVAILLDLEITNQTGWKTIAMLKERSETQDIPLIIFSMLSLQQRSIMPDILGWVYQSVDQVSLAEVLKRISRQRDQMRRILIVEDDLDLARVLITVFERHEIQTAHAQTEEEAIYLCQHFHPDLLVLDLTLAQGDGLAVANWLRQQDRLCQTPLIVYSAKDLDRVEQAELQLGKTEFMTKSRNSPEAVEQQMLRLLHQVTFNQ